MSPLFGARVTHREHASAVRGVPGLGAYMSACAGGLQPVVLQARNQGLSIN